MLQPETEAPPNTGLIDSMSQKWQYILDKLSPQIAVRWVMMLVAVSLYFLRVYFLNGWFIVTYGLGIYLLNQMIGFVSPQFDPEDSDSDMGLPTREREEFRFVFFVSFASSPMALADPSLADYQNLNFGILQSEQCWWRPA